MSLKSSLSCAAAVTGIAAWIAVSPAQALTAQECSAKYQAAKTAGTLNGQKWNDFRKSQCSDAAAATTTAAPAAPKEASKKEAAPSKDAKKESGAPSLPSGPAIFPAAVDPKYAKESAGKARLHTCVDQYKANKATSANGGMKWIDRGGGYYSECNKRLKG